jgi:hypothetical protein
MVVLDLWDQQEDADAISRRRERLTDLALALEVAWFDPLHIGLIVDGPVRSGGSGVLGGVVVQLCRTGVGTCGGTATTADQAGPLPSARANGYVGALGSIGCVPGRVTGLSRRPRAGALPRARAWSGSRWSGQYRRLTPEAVCSG